jgi:hypothetical protein
MTKVIFIIWLGYGETQTMSMHIFEGEHAVADCTAAKAAMADAHDRFDTEWVKCIPFQSQDDPR